LDLNYHTIYGNGIAVDYIAFANDNSLTVSSFNGTFYVVTTTQVFRDPSAWYHIVVAMDTTQATASNRIKIYVNGVQVTAFSTSTYPSQNYDTGYNTTTAQYLGYNTFNYFDGYLAEVNWVDGQQLTPSSFGSTNSTTGVWQPAKYTGAYGTNGFYLPFTNTTSTTTLGYDSSGNGNNWTTNNISLTAGSTYDSMTDVPTLTSATAANYAVINPLWKDSTLVIKDGNLDVSQYNNGAFSSLIMPTGSKYYCEVTVTIVEGFQAVGIIKASVLSGSLASTTVFGGSGYGYYAPNGNKYALGTASAYGSSWGTVGDVIGIAVDLSANTLTFYKNNTSQGAITITGGVDYLFTVGNAGADGGVAFNFGQRPFSYTPPSGFVALNTYNLPASTVPNGASYMAATLYTGTGATQTITNTVGSVSFTPDFVWVKSRSTANSHLLADIVRGSTKVLLSNDTAAEITDANYTTFVSGGFSESGNGNENNNSGKAYVAWNWKAGGTAVSNTNGSITSSVSANTTSGFSVATYTGNGTGGATVGHGLGVAPSMVVVKQRTSASATSWYVYHTSLTAAYAIYWNLTLGRDGTSLVFWNNTAPTSSVFSIGTSSGVNASSGTYVAYCFAQIAGFSAFGSYTGNGSTDGPFVYLGFRPRYLMLKVSGTDGYDWLVYDSSRDPYNVTQYNLRVDTNDAESTQSANYLDFLSNGFKIRGSSAGSINPSQTVIYAAFAENPFQNSLAR
jgi:hypothetical protein